KIADDVAVNQALCGLYAAGLGRARDEVKVASTAVAVSTPQPIAPKASASHTAMPITDITAAPGNRYTELGRLFAQVLDRANTICGNTPHVEDAIVITGAAIGLPGTEHIFDDTNVARILRGDQLIDVIPTRFRRDMLDKNITRL